MSLAAPAAPFVERDLSDAQTPPKRQVKLDWGQRLRRRPALPVAIAWIVGVVFHAALPHHPGAFIAVAGIAAMMVLLLKYRVACLALLAVAIIAAAIARAQIVSFFYPGDHIANFTTDEPRICQLELVVNDPPRLLKSTGSHQASERQVMRATVARMLTTEGWRDVSGDIVLQLDEPVQTLAIGQRLRIVGRIQRPSPPMNPGQFDWQRYYRDQRILASVNIPHAAAVTILSEGRASPVAWLRAKARDALAAGFSQSHSIDHALLRALVLGDSDPELRDIQEQFRRTGTSHHLAISGMHVAVLGLVVYFACLVLRLMPRNAIFIGLGFTILYGLVALPSPPVLRSIILCTVVGVGILCRRRIDGVNLLAVTVLAMLINNPSDLFNAGFQLSFGMVFGLMLLSDHVTRRLMQLDEDTRVLLSFPQAVPRSLRVKLWLRRKVVGIVTPAIIAWLVSLPLISYHFEQLNPWAIFASILLAAPVLVALVSGFAKILLTLLIPAGASAWAWIAANAVASMRLSVAWLDKLPGSDVPMPTPPLWLIAIYYALLLVPILPIERFHRLRRFAPILALALLAALPLRAALAPAPSCLKLTVLSVGAGQCAVVELPDRQTLLFDVGSSTSSDLERRTLGPFFRHEGRSRIDAMFLSHRDFDHIGGAADVVSSRDVGRIHISPHFRKFAPASPPAEDLVEFLDRTKHAPSLLAAGDTRALSPDAKLEVLWPPAECNLDSNNTGLVLRLSYAGRSILFPADIQEPAQRALLADPDQLKSDILVAPHHGSAESTTAAFVNAVAPKIILSSNDNTLSSKQRRFDKLIGPRPLYRTNRCGAITVTINPDGAIAIQQFLTARETSGAR